VAILKRVKRRIREHVRRYVTRLLTGFDRPHVARVDESLYDPTSPYNPLQLMVSRLGVHSISKCVCAWSDLLGFGTPFKESAWQPSKHQWSAIANRLQKAYAIHCGHPPMTSVGCTPFVRQKVKTLPRPIEKSCCLRLDRC